MLSFKICGNLCMSPSGSALLTHPLKLLSCFDLAQSLLGQTHQDMNKTLILS